VFAPAVLASRRAFAGLPPLPNIAPSDALLLRPGDLQFSAYEPAFNARTMLTPQLRAMCKTANGVSVMVDWCRTNNLPFALRCGGHSFEGLSQSASVVIDTRLINAVSVDTAAKTVTVGAGASLGAVYKAVWPHNLAFAAGSCPTVGISGHALGGGYGNLARPFGLTCDSLLSLDLVDPQGHPVHADAQQNSDLFWACRGGGGGSFGVATSYRFGLRRLASLLVFRIDWQGLAPARAAALMKQWQAWAPQAPASINATLVITRHAGGGIDLRCSGQSIGSQSELKRELKTLSSAPQIRSMSFSASINYFAGGAGGWVNQSAPMKGKSDYAASPLSDTGLAALMNQVDAKKTVYVICDAYGGAIADVAADATAFAHRKATLFAIQYASQWSNPADTPQRLADMRDLYTAMRPYVSGAAYVNYCDLDLSDWQNAYWGANLARLKQIKSAFDPANVFRHAQSVPPG
jgi:FAD/FMN-containing dehydrogenase